MTSPSELSEAMLAERAELNRMLARLVAMNVCPASLHPDAQVAEGKGAEIMHRRAAWVAGVTGVTFEYFTDLTLDQWHTINTFLADYFGLEGANDEAGDAQ